MAKAAFGDLLANWERFLHEHTTIDPLIRMAIGHYQFEAIHPFTDGNGRTGRILNLLFLVEQNLLGAPVLYLSGAITAASRTTIVCCWPSPVTDWEPWLLFMLGAVTTTARSTTEKIRAIRNLVETTPPRYARRAPRLSSRELVELLFYSPHCRIGNVVESGIAQRQTASEYLKALCGIGVLQERKAGREKLFINPRLLRLLTTGSQP